MSAIFWQMCTKQSILCNTVTQMHVFVSVSVCFQFVCYSDDSPNANTHTHTPPNEWNGNRNMILQILCATVWNSIIYSKYRHNKHMKTLRFVGSVISVTVLSVLFHSKQYALIAFWLAQNVKRSHRKYDDFRSYSVCFGFCTANAINKWHTLTKLNPTPFHISIYYFFPFSFLSLF